MKYQKTKLSDGSSLVVIHMPSYAVTISAYIKAGFRYDPKKNAGLSHFVEHMLFSGTKKYPTHKDLAFAIERHGGWHTAYTWVDYQSHFVHLPYKNFEDGIEVLLETLHRSLLFTEEVEKEKGRVREEILRTLADPEKAIISHVWFPLFFQSTVLGRSYFGSLKDIEKISQPDVIRFYDSEIRSGETCFVVAGNISLPEAKETIDNFFRKHKVSYAQTDMPVTLKDSSKIRVALKKARSHYVSVIVGIPTVSLYDQDRHAIEILHNVLARDFGARLPDRLRSQGGLVYTCSASQENFIDTGYFYFRTATQKQNLEKVLSIIIDEFDRLSQGDISDEEIETAKANISGSLLSNMQTSFDYIGWYGPQELLNPGRIIHPDDQVKIYNQISKKTILGAAKLYFSHNKILIAAYGDTEKNTLEKFLK